MDCTFKDLQIHEKWGPKVLALHCQFVHSSAEFFKFSWPLPKYHLFYFDLATMPLKMSYFDDAPLETSTCNALREKTRPFLKGEAWKSDITDLSQMLQNNQFTFSCSTLYGMRATPPLFDMTKHCCVGRESWPISHHYKLAKEESFPSKQWLWSIISGPFSKCHKFWAFFHLSRIKRDKLCPQKRGKCCWITSQSRQLPSLLSFGAKSQLERRICTKSRVNSRTPLSQITSQVRKTILNSI